MTSFTNINAQCTSNATSTADYYVRYVKITEGPWDARVQLLLNVTEDWQQDAGYGDFKSTSFNAISGNSYSNMLRGKYGIDNSINPSWWKVWIDFNKDGKFDGANEEMVSKEGDAYAYQNFTIPTDVATGDYIFRVATSSSAINSACDDITQGEIEDYTIKITNNGTAAVGTETIANLVAYPNPIANDLKISFGEDISSVSVYTVLGSVIYKNENPIGRNLEIDTRAWKTGLYFVDVRKGERRQTLKVIKQ